MRANDIVITGGSGFIGINLFHEFNDNCTILDKNPLHVDNSVQLDMLDLPSLKKILKTLNPTIIIHLAGSLEETEAAFINNVKLTYNLYKAASNLRTLKYIITFGTSDEYGQNKPPFVETQKEMPSTFYSLSKTYITYLSTYFFQQQKLPIVVVRPFLVYGEYQKKQFIPHVINQCLGNEPIVMTPGEQTRDLVYVKDIGMAVKKIIEKPGLGGNIFNLCSGKETKLRDIAVLIKKITNSKSDINFNRAYRKAEIMRLYGSNEKAQKLIGWSPKYSFREGITKTIEWYKHHLE